MVREGAVAVEEILGRKNSEAQEEESEDDVDSLVEQAETATTTPVAATNTQPSPVAATVTQTAPVAATVAPAPAATQAAPTLTNTGSVKVGKAVTASPAPQQQTASTVDAALTQSPEDFLKSIGLG